MAFTKPALLLAAFAAVTPLAFAQDDPEKAQLRKELAELRQQQSQMQEKFDKRITELEKKLNEKPKDKPAEGHVVKTEVLNQLRYDFDSGANDSFYSRRLEVKFTGQVNKKVSFTAMADFAKTLKQDANGNVDQGSRILQDAYASVALGGPWSIDLGQKKIPFSMEALQSTGELDTLERALFLAQGKFGDVRDQGLWVNAKFPEVTATAAVTNGAGETQNSKDGNEQKSYGGRVVFKPKSLPGFQVGGSAISGTDPSNFRKERVGFEAMYKNADWTLKTEAATALTGGIRQTGWYGHAGYKFQPDFEAILRYDTFDPNRAVNADDITDVIFGLNYYLQGNDAKLQLNMVNRRFGDTSHRTMWQLGLQTRW